MTANETQIRSIVEDWAKAVPAKDMDGVLANHTDDIVMFDVPMPLQSLGMEEYRKTWDLFFDHCPGGPGAFDVTELHVAAGDSVAYCHALVQIFDSKVRVTIGLRKEQQQWLIAHEHHSYPIDIESGK
jgi:ketosteroid isomerase-like protein